MINIKEKRKQLHLTQEQLADRIGVTVQAVSQWETGRTMPDPGNLPLLAEALKITLAELLGDGHQTSWTIKDTLFSTEHMYTRMKATAEAEGLTLTQQALYYAREKHSGQYRKTGRFSEERVPYFSHPLLMVCQAHAMGIREDETLAAVLLHDVCEDCGVRPEELPFPEPVQHTVELLTKRKDLPEEEYFRRIAEDETACLIKLLDRCSNVSLMAAVFTDEKLTEYIRETEDWILPLADNIKRSAYSSAAFLLKYQISSTIETIKAMMRR